MRRRAVLGLPSLPNDDCWNHRKSFFRYRARRFCDGRTFRDGSRIQGIFPTRTINSRMDVRAGALRDQPTINRLSSSITPKPANLARRYRLLWPRRGRRASNVLKLGRPPRSAEPVPRRLDALRQRCLKVCRLSSFSRECRGVANFDPALSTLSSVKSPANGDLFAALAAFFQLAYAPRTHRGRRTPTAAFGGFLLA